MVWGFLRETKYKAIKAGIDKDTGLCRTGLDDYLKVIFPEIKDWIHDQSIDKIVDGKKCKRRPDYRSEKLKLIIEFDGIHHYRSPNAILNDKEVVRIYNQLGYKVVRIPYFIQLTNKAVKQIFGKSVKFPLFDESIPSLGVKGNNTPASLCPAGIKRMAEDFKKFPEQYKVNIDFLKQQNQPFLSGVDFLEKEYKKL